MSKSAFEMRSLVAVLILGVILRLVLLWWFQGQPLYIEDEQWETPLHKAARRGHKDVVKQLLEKGADPNATNMLGMTPLHWAAMSGQEDIAEELVESGCDTHVRSGHLDGLMPSEVAKALGYEEFIETVVRHSYAW